MTGIKRKTANQPRYFWTAASANPRSVRGDDVDALQFEIGRRGQQVPVVGVDGPKTVHRGRGQVQGPPGARNRFGELPVLGIGSSQRAEHERILTLGKPIRLLSYARSQPDYVKMDCKLVLHFSQCSKLKGKKVEVDT